MLLTRELRPPSGRSGGVFGITTHSSVPLPFRGPPNRGNTLLLEPPAVQMELVRR